MPKKHLGQHFITNPSLAKKIVDYADIKKDEIVLEIGPGKGILTKEILKKAKKVIVIEKDEELVEELKDNITGFKNLTKAGKIKNNISDLKDLTKVGKIQIICGDALKVKWPKFDKIVANLPYNISSPFMFRLFDIISEAQKFEVLPLRSGGAPGEHKFKKAVLLFQKEFADRFAAKPCEKRYSRLTVATNYYCKTKILKKVSNVNFYPKPKVDSAVVEFIPKKPGLYERGKSELRIFKADKKFWLLVKELFRHKRKLVRAALKVSNITSLVNFKKAGKIKNISALTKDKKNKKPSAHIFKEKIENFPENLANKRVVCCTLKDLKEIYDILI